MSPCPSFDLALPKSLEEASQYLKDHPQAMILGGGTDLIPKINRGQFAPPALVSLSQIPGLKKIENKEDSLIIGSMVPLWELEKNPAIRPIEGLLQALKNTASHTIRGSATIGGNLLQDSRCKFVDKSSLWREGVGYCMKVKGDTCRVAPGHTLCSATYCSDLAPVLIALGARVNFQNLEEKRSLPLEKIFGEDGRKHILKEPWEILTEIEIPLPAPESWSQKITSRKGIDFPEVNLALSWKKESQKIRICAVFGALDCRPLSFQRTLSLAHLSEELEDWWKEVYAQLKPKDTLYYPPLYRKKMAHILWKQGMERIFASYLQK